MPKIATLSVTRKLMQAHGVSAKKSLGQNFIIEPQVISRIVAASACDKRDLVLEIGPGLGSLTQALAEAAGRVAAVEIDASLLGPLRQSFAASPNVAIVHADALTADLSGLLEQQHTPGLRPGFLAVANLPYYITTPLLMRFLAADKGFGWRRLVFMVQKELAARMQAGAGSRDYGALSLAVQYRARAEIAFSVPAGCFLPRPKVDSAVIVLDRLEQPPLPAPLSPRQEELFFAAVRAGFNQRRKTLLNSLSSGLALPKEQTLAALQAADIDPGRRAESLSLPEFAALARALADFPADQTPEKKLDYWRINH